MTDSLNVVPFEPFRPDLNEIFSCGICLKYTPSEEELILIIRYRLEHDEYRVRDAFHCRGITGVNEIQPEADLYPLHSDTEVFGSLVKQINLNTRTVLLQNNMIYSIQNTMDEIDRLI